jgi:hypothetical protein
MTMITDSLAVVLQSRGQPGHKEIYICITITITVAAV